MKRILVFFLILLAIPLRADEINENKIRAAEIENEMWAQCRDYFKVRDIPEKWKDEPGVIIAKDIRLSYKKELIISNLRYNYYSHFRIMLQSKVAVEHYSAFTIPGSRGRSNMYAGFKIIKKDGTQNIISLDKMVNEKSAYNNYEMDIYKLAIPDLEVGDIIDYYIAEERTISIYGIKFYSFDPVILELNSELPIMKQRIAFDVLRRCYINMKSLNGAPDFKLSTEEDEEDINRYVIEDENREKVDELIWFYSYREVPTIKFKVTYASAMAAEFSSFLGRAGDLKSNISTKDLSDYLKLVFGNVKAPELKSLMKRNYKHLEDNLEIAKTAYYLLRYLYYIKSAENYYLNGYYERKGRNFIRELSTYYRSQEINHKIIVGIPRSISNVDDLILENELTFAIQVEEDGKKYYVSNFDQYSYFGELDPQLQGSEVFLAEHLGTTIHLTRGTMPVIEAEENKVNINYRYTITDLDKGSFELNGKKIVGGANRAEYQTYLMDFYSFKKEERDLHPYHDEFEGQIPKSITELVKKQKEIIAARPEKFKDRLKEMLTADLPELEIRKVNSFNVLETGRFEDSPKFIYDFKANVKGPLKKVGPNYILSIGKLLDTQLEIPEDQLIRKYNIYMEFARKYEYTLEVNIPEGYEVQGLEQLSTEVSNSTGTFLSKASMDDDKLVIQTLKEYKSNYEPVENWAMILDFIDAAKKFENSQLLLKKIN